MRALNGSVYLLITCADTAALIEKIIRRGINIHDITQEDDLTIQICCSVRHLPDIRRIASNFGGKVKVQRFFGIYKLCMRLYKRKILFLGIVVFLLFLSLLPTRILFLKVEGNREIETNLILDKAEECGIRFGISRRTIRSESVKNALLSKIPQLQWVGINTSGCTATISIKEKTAQTSDDPPFEAGNIIASRDGIVHDLTVINGTAVCREGDAVLCGQILVSGYMDCGNLIKTVRSEAEVFACTMRTQTVVSPDQYTKRTEEIEKHRRFTLRVGKKLINLRKDSGISGVSCVKMYLEDYLKLPGGFRFPVSLITEEIIEYKCDVSNRADIHGFLSDCSEHYLLTQMSAGQVLHTTQAFSQQEGVCVLNARYICSEMIGQFAKEELFYNDGKTD